MKIIYVKIEGIHCDHCVTYLTKKLKELKNVKKVVFDKRIAEISYTGTINNNDLINKINNGEYFTKNDYISENKKDLQNITLKEFIIILLVIILISIILNKLLGFNILNIIPNIDNNISYGMLFVTGLLTSVHCITMCGAINLTATLSNTNSLKKSILYNTGRVLSYTIIGALVGLIGKAFSFNDTINGIIVIASSIIMFLISLRMLGLINYRLFHIKYKTKSKSPFAIGLLNGLMPCGPIDAMKVYALSTASPLSGALSLFLFGLGTVPLMLMSSVFFNIFKGKTRRLINKIASILILVLSLVMLNRGLLYLNIDISNMSNNYDNYTVSTLKGDTQTIKFSLDYSNYQDILLLNNIKTKIIIHVDKDKLTSCNNTIEIKEFNIKKKLKVGDNIIEFTPNKAGDFTITCWMNMIHNKLKVTDNKTYFNKHTTGEKMPVNLKEPKSIPVLAKTNDNGDIVIDKSNIKRDATYIDYIYENIHIGLIAVKTTDNRVVVVVNTCASCTPSPRAYFIQVDDYLECQNCGSRFKIDELDKLSNNGCHPISASIVSEDSDKIVVSHEELDALKDKFKNWLGPKVEKR